MHKILLALVAFTASAFAADIDGKWLSERKMERDGQAFTFTQTFDLKSDGSKLDGTLAIRFGDMEGQPVKIADGKVDGSKFTFSVTIPTPNGDLKLTYSGTIEGALLKGTSVRDGGEPRPFEAKKQ